MNYKDLRDFIAVLEQRGELVRIRHEVDPNLEMTEIADRTLRAGGPALLFENPKGSRIPVLANLFGTQTRVALGMGAENVQALREIGEILAYLRQPDPPKGLRDAWEKAPLLKQVMNMGPKVVRNAPCQFHAKSGDDVDLYQLPIQTCWPGDAGPLVTWPLVITRGPNKTRQNLGIYRMQLIGRNKLILRWLSHRGGALDYRDWQLQNPGQRYPVAIALGADPATTLGAVTPVPDSLSEYAFAGLLRGAKTELAECYTAGCRDHGLQVPASAEIILEGYLEPGEMADEGPFGDHTGYYNEVERFPVFTVEAITHREDPIYHSTYTGRPPDEPAILGLALNEVFVPYGNRHHAQGVPGARQTRDAGRVVIPAPVHVHEVCDCHRRGRQCPRLAGCDLGHDHPHGSATRQRVHRKHPHRLPGLCLAGGRPGFKSRL